MLEKDAAWKVKFQVKSRLLHTRKKIEKWPVTLWGITTWKSTTSWLHLSPQTLPEQVAPSSCPTYTWLHTHQVNVLWGYAKSTFGGNRATLEKPGKTLVALAGLSKNTMIKIRLDHIQIIFSPKAQRPPLPPGRRGWAGLALCQLSAEQDKKTDFGQNM